MSVMYGKVDDNKDDTRNWGKTQEMTKEETLNWQSLVKDAEEFHNVLNEMEKENIYDHPDWMKIKYYGVPYSPRWTPRPDDYMTPWPTDARIAEAMEFDD